MRGLRRILGLSWIISSPLAAMSLDSVRNSVFKIEVVSQTPKFGKPWLQNTSTSGSGTGFYIGGNRIMTNAHVVAGGRYITVQRDGDDRPLEVLVKFIAHDSDLAILEPRDATHEIEARALQFGGLPGLLRTVSTIGYPRGGDQISITEGVVSRISYRRYVHTSHHQHLLVQVDSAINPGNSGGPVLQGSRVVGVAFQSFTGAENTGYIIPTPVIQRFLRDIEDGRYDGHPVDGLTVMNSAMENQATRRFHGLDLKQGGVEVVHVERYAPPYGVIQPGDVLLAIAGQPIGVDGRIRFQGERVDFRVVYDLGQIGDRMDFRIVRGGKVQDVAVRLQKAKPHPPGENLYPVYPKYLSFAGLVFTSVTRDFLKGWGKRWFRQAPILLRYLHWNWQHEEGFEDAEDIVVLAARLPHPVNAYVEDYEERVVVRVNGRSIKGLKDLDKALGEVSGDSYVFDFYGPNAPIVMNREKALQAHAEILKTYGVNPEKWLVGADEADGAMGGRL